MNIIKRKGCRKCGGDLFMEVDSYGVVISCLQCGANDITRTEVQPELKNKPKIAAR